MRQNNFALLLFVWVAFAFTVSAQNLTVRDIMREPSMAGMRPDSERLSPDGKLVAFSWNAEGKEPRDLYIASTSGGEPRILVKAEDNFDKRTEPPASKLGYGLTVRDEFVRAREKNLFGVEFSPDSKKILFIQNSDIYILDLSQKNELTEQQAQDLKSKWLNYESHIRRRLDLIPNLIEATKMSGIQEQNLLGEIADTRAELINALEEGPKNANGDKSEEQRNKVLTINRDLDQALNKLFPVQQSISRLQSDTVFSRLQDELMGVGNRINVARLDYKDVIASLTLLKPKRLTRTQSPENRAFWLDNTRIAFVSGGNFFSINTSDGTLTQLTKEANPTAFISIGTAAKNEAGDLLGYVVSDGSRQRALFVPNYLDEFTAAPTFRRGWTEQKVYVAKTDGSLELPFEIKLPKAEGAGYIRSLKWAADDTSVLVDRIDKDTKRRQLFFVHNVGSKAEKIILVTEETDEKWVAPLSRIVEPHPKDNSKILFASERDGYNHLYLATLERAKAEPNPTGVIRQENPSDPGFTGKAETKQLTKGNFEIDFAKWRKERNEIVFSSTEENTSGRQFYTYVTDTGNKSAVPSNSKGMKTEAQMSSSGTETFITYKGSEWNKPSEVFAQRICPECRGLNMPQQITNSVPAQFKNYPWSEPKFTDIPSRDGKIIKSKIYLPAEPGNISRNQRAVNSLRPMVIFVHGAGYLQNTINGWNNYYREFMFHTLLVQKGYVVLDIDFRGSAGYGRDWRTDVYDFLGSKDYEDHLDAIDYMVKTHGVDPKKVGVYGGSYGGFMAEMLAMRAPDKVAAAAALRPVADWKNYFASSPVYTTERLGFPDKNPEAYKRSSPISYADKLQRPLLILHGMVDDNVHAQDSVQLIEKLIRLEKTKYFEAMLYPSENHGFTRPESWADEYERILWFFEKHLKN